MLLAKGPRTGSVDWQRRTGAIGVFDFFDAFPAFPRAPADIELTGRYKDGFLIENFEMIPGRTHARTKWVFSATKDHFLRAFRPEKVGESRGMWEYSGADPID